MHPRLISPLVCLLLFLLPFSAVAADSLPAVGWDQTLDRIQAWTWNSRTELNERLEKEEARTGQVLAAYISAWEQRLNARSPSTLTGAADSHAPLKVEVFRRLVAAKTVQYLRSGDQKSLAEGIQLSERFSGRLMQTDTAFWYFYPRALADIQARDTDVLQKDAFSLLNNVVLWGEPLLSGRRGRFDQEQNAYSLNLADLIINRAIIQQKLDGLESLGAIIWLLNNRSGIQGVTPGEVELQRRISGVKQHLTGPESDNLRLNYAVAMYEAGRHRKLLFREIDGKGNSDAVMEHFTAARDYLHLAYTWAGTVQGRVTAAAGFLELENLALERMSAYLPPGITASLVETPGRITPDMAAGLFGELAARESYQESWERLGFSDRKAYIQGSRRLWSVLQRHALLVGGQRLQKINRDDYRSIVEHSGAVEKPLLGYVQLFKTYTTDGQREIMPDSAYFAYAESLKLLARLKSLSLAYDSSIDSYRTSVGYLLQGAAVYPYDESISEYLAAGRNINTGDLNLLPDRVFAGIVANDVVNGCLQGDESICPVSARESLRWDMYKVRNRLNAFQRESRQAEIGTLLTAWRESLPTGKAPADRQAADESRVMARGRQFGREARLLAERTAVAEKEVQLCRGQWQACGNSKVSTEALLAERNKLEKTKNDLLMEADRLNNARTTSGRKAAEYSSRLALLAEDEFVHLSDRIFALASSQLKDKLARSDDHPMHRSIRNGFYRNRQPAGY